MGTYTAEGRRFNGRPKYRLDHAFNNKVHHVYLYYSISQNCWYVGDLQCLRRGEGGTLKGTHGAAGPNASSGLASPLHVTEWKYVDPAKGWRIDRHITAGMAKKQQQHRRHHHHQHLSLIHI